MDEVGRITRAAGVVGSLTLLSRVTGLLRDMLFGYLLGAHGAADAFFVAFRVPNLLRRLTAEGALTAGFVPVFTDYLTRSTKEEAMQLARIVFTFAAVVLGVLTVLGVYFAPVLAYLFAPRYLEFSEKFNLTILLIRWMFPYVYFVSLVALAMGFLNSFRHFMAPALSPVLLNLSIILCAVFISPYLDQPALGLAFGVLLGGVLQLVLQLPYLYRFGLSLAPDWHFKHPALRHMLLLMGPALFGAAVYQVNVLVSTMLASMLAAGSISYLYYADRFLQFPLGVFAIALGTAALPSFSSLAAKKDYQGLQEGVAYSLRLVNFISLPATLGLMVLSVPVFAVLFQRGAFDARTTTLTAEALVYFSFGLWAISGSRLVVPAFYALKDTKTPVRVACFTFGLNLLLSLMLMGPVAAGPDAGWLSRYIAGGSQLLGVFSLSHGGLALANSLSSTCQFLLLLWLLQHRLGEFRWRGFMASFGRALCGALLMAAPLYFIVHNIDWTGPGNKMAHIAILFLLPVLGLSLYVGLSLMWPGPERQWVRQVASTVKGRFTR